MKNIIILLFCLIVGGIVTAQTSEGIKGRVIDKDTREPLIGVSVVLKSSSFKGTVTDIDGNFTLNTTIGTELEISYIGYKTVLTNILQYQY